MMTMMMIMMMIITIIIIISTITVIRFEFRNKNHIAFYLCNQDIPNDPLVNSHAIRTRRYTTRHPLRFLYFRSLCYKSYR